MNYLLDTNICVYWLKGDESIEKRSCAIGLEAISVSFLTISYIMALINPRRSMKIFLLLKN